jgi:hypothetical protein
MPVHAALLLVVLVSSGCGGQSSSVLNAEAPLSPEVTVWYPVGDFNVKGPIGLKALRGRDGEDAWVAATGEYATPALGFPVQVGDANGNYDQWYELSASPTAVYIPTTSNPTGLSAISMADGAQLWRIAVAGYLPGNVVQEDGVAFAFLAGSQNDLGPSIPSRLVAINAHTCRVYWERDIPDDLK